MKRALRYSARSVWVCSDLAVGALVRDLAITNRMGTRLDSFIRETWVAGREPSHAYAW